MTGHDNRLGWMLDEILNIHHTRSAILLSSDGLLMAYSTGLDPTQAERFAAAMAGVQSLSRSSAEFCGPTDSQRTWKQTLFEFDGGYLFLVAAGPRAYVALSAGPEVDMEAVTFRLQDTVRRVGRELTTGARTEAGT